jgi:opacity protein-like surface antigen
MKKMLFVSACMVALSAGGASAQNQPAPGASSNGNVGPGASADHSMNKHKGMTTGSATTRRHEKVNNSNNLMANPSGNGNVGPGTNNLNGPSSGGR